MAIQISQTKSILKRGRANFALFSAGKLISIFGTAIYSFAIGLHVLKSTGSGLSFAATLVFSILPVVIFGPFSGVIADKFDKKKTIILMDVLNGFLFAALFLITSKSGVSLAVIYASTFLSTTLTTVFNTSISSAMPRLVKEDKLINLNSAGRIIDSSSSVLAPLLGGMIFALVDLKLFMIVNAVSFFLSAIMECFIDFDFNNAGDLTASTKKVSLAGDIKDGIKFIFANSEIKKIIGILVAINFFLSLSATVPLPYIINNVLKLSAKSFGLLEAMFPLGIIAGALFVKKIIARTEHMSLMRFTGVMISLCIMLIALPLFVPVSFSEAAYVWYYSVVMVVFGVIISLVDIPIIYRLQVTVPEDYRGRVMSIGISIGKIVQPAAYIISGLLLGTLNAAFIVTFGGVMMLVFTGVVLGNKEKGRR